MPSVYVYFAAKAFLSEEELCRYLLPTYTEDGDMVRSPFMREVNLQCFEPACIERIVSEEASTLRSLVDGASYSNQWIHLVPGEIRADVAVLIYTPNFIVCPAEAKRLRLLATLDFAVQ